MNTSLYISSGALQAIQQKLDTTSNNVANVNTTGYKRREQSFAELLASQINNNQSRVNQETGRLTANGLRVGYGVRTGMTQLDMQQGQALQTGNPFDLMIQGKGFFQVSGGDGEARFTRDGKFHLSANPDQPGSYHLVHANGGLLLDQTGNPIVMDEQFEVQILSNGQIQFRGKNGQTNAFLSGQQIGIYHVENPSILRNVGENQFSIDPGALPNGANPADYVQLLPEEEAQIASGFLESSNVDLGKEMTELMTSQRSYQMNARAVSYAEQMLGIANNILR